MAEAHEKKFHPYVAAATIMPEFSIKAVVAGSIFGIIFGAATVYLALTAGLTVTASIPIAVLAISLLRPLKATILENNIVQTIGSAGESIAAGVAFTIPALIFLEGGAGFFNYWNIFSLALVGGTLGVLFMVPMLLLKVIPMLDLGEGVTIGAVLLAYALIGLLVPVAIVGARGGGGSGARSGRAGGAARGARSRSGVRPGG